MLLRFFRRFFGFEFQKVQHFRESRSQDGDSGDLWIFHLWVFRLNEIYGVLQWQKFRIIHFFLVLGSGKKHLRVLWKSFSLISKVVQVANESMRQECWNWLVQFAGKLPKSFRWKAFSDLQLWNWIVKASTICSRTFHAALITFYGPPKGLHGLKMYQPIGAGQISSFQVPVSAIESCELENVAELRPNFGRRKAVNRRRSLTLKKNQNNQKQITLIPRL